MKRLLLFVAAITLTSCGLSGWIDPRAEAAFEELSPLVIKAVRDRYPLSLPKTLTPNIYLVEEPGKCFGLEEQVLAGCYDGYLSIEVSLTVPGWANYDWRTTLIHELLHYYGLLLAGVVDYDHTSPLFTELEPALFKQLEDAVETVSKSDSVSNEICTAEIVCDRGVIVFTCRDWNPWDGPGAKRRVVMPWGRCWERERLA